MSNVKMLIDALRFGQAVGAKSSWRWAGAVGLVAGIAFYVSKANGWLEGVLLDEWMEMVQVAIDLGITIGAYSVVATNEKAGILPRAAQLDVDELHDSELSTNADKAESSAQSSGFPDGPFWNQ